MSRYWLTWAVGGEVGGEERKMWREIKVQRMKGKLDGLREKCGEKMEHERQKESGREIWHFSEGGGEELFIPRFGCIPGCLALILTASCFFCFFFSSYLQTDWTPELPSPCLIQTFQTWPKMVPPRVCSWMKKGTRAFHTCHLSFLTQLDFGPTHKYRSLPTWSMSPAARTGCTFFLLSAQHQNCRGKLWVEIRHIFFGPSGSGERLETFLAGQ